MLSTMNRSGPGTPRHAQGHDIEPLLSLWGLLFDETPEDVGSWRGHARVWFDQVVADQELACFPVVEVRGQILACAVGSLELGVPNPYCPHGRTVRLANVVTVPGHRGKGFGTALVEFVVDWARAIQADRVDLSATPDGQRIYTRSGFVLTSAPRMKLVL